VKPYQTKALIFGGMAMLLILPISAIINFHLYPESYKHPIEVTATVIDTGQTTQGGGPTYKPTFQFEVDGKLYAATTPSATRIACQVGEKYTVITEKSDLRKIADPNFIRSRNISLTAGFFLGSLLLIAGLFLSKSRLVPYLFVLPMLTMPIACAAWLFSGWNLPKWLALSCLIWFLTFIAVAIPIHIYQSRKT